MEGTQFRNKVTWFSFGFSLLVVWVHSYNAVLYLGTSLRQRCWCPGFSGDWETA